MRKIETYPSSNTAVHDPEEKLQLNNLNIIQYTKQIKRKRENVKKSKEKTSGEND